MYISFLIAAILLTLSPGPDILYVLSVSLKNGAKKGVFLSLGLVSGIIIHTSLLAFGFSALIKATPVLFNTIKWLGAFYLFYIAFMTFKKTTKTIANETQESIKSQESIALVKQGFYMNILNPKVTLFFLSFFPKFIDTTKNTILETYKLGFIFMLQALIIFSLVAFSAARLTNYINNSSFDTFIKWFQIVVLLGIGIFVLL